MREGNDTDTAEGGLRFSHEAMATVFEILVVADDADYAARAAHAAFDELDMIEEHLSRFRETSDVSMVNALPPGQGLVLGPDAYQCIRTALEISAQTGGAFDVTVGRCVDAWDDTETTADGFDPEKHRQSLDRMGWETLQLDEAAHTITVGSEGMAIDLGGIGKGYAVDRMGQTLGDWGLERCLLHGGTSSVLALDGPSDGKGWPVALPHPRRFAGDTVTRMDLRHCAVGGSGLEKGAHIIDPRTGRPAVGRFAAWSLASTAAKADGLSTAFMLMDISSIEGLCAADKDAGAIIISDECRCAGTSIKRVGWHDRTLGI